MNAIKTYPLEVHSFYDGYGYFSKGHHSKEVFADAIKREYGDEICTGRVDHTWQRVRPALPHERDDYGNVQFFEEAKHGARGAFPMTQVLL